VPRNFDQEFHIPEYVKVFVSTCVPKHLILELWLKEYIIIRAQIVLVGDYLVIPHVLSHRLIYFLLHDLLKLLEDVPLAVRAGMWYMHDCALAHFNRAVI
jgi:hypothetical protein